MPKLLLNVATISTTPGLKALVGVQPYDKEVLDKGRQEYRGNYFLKRGGEDGASILAIPLKPGLPPLGDTTEEQELAKAPWLLAPLGLEALTAFFETVRRPILKQRPLRILSAQPGNILPSHPSMPDWLQRRLILN